MPKPETRLTADPAGPLEDGDLGRPRTAAGDAPAERPCLSCGTMFDSEGWHNRLCRRCAKRSSTMGTYAARGASRPRRGGQD